MYRTLKKTIDNGLCYEQLQTMHIQLIENNNTWSCNVCLVTDVDDYGLVAVGFTSLIPTATASQWWYNKVIEVIADVVEQYYGFGYDEADTDEWVKKLTEDDFKGDKWKEHRN